jgi:hypothetical protein
MMNLYSYATVNAAEVPAKTMYKPLLKNKPAGMFTYVVPAVTENVSAILGSLVLEAGES